MSQIIKIKRSETASAEPSSSDLATHEIAMNVSDKKIFTKKADGTITVTVASHTEGIATEDDILA